MYLSSIMECFSNETTRYSIFKREIKTDGVFSTGSFDSTTLRLKYYDTDCLAAAGNKKYIKGSVKGSFDLAFQRFPNSDLYSYSLH